MNDHDLPFGKQSPMVFAFPWRSSATTVPSYGSPHQRLHYVWFPLHPISLPPHQGGPRTLHYDLTIGLLGLLPLADKYMLWLITKVSNLKMNK
jgi:hypothetical protein